MDSIEQKLIQLEIVVLHISTSVENSYTECGWVSEAEHVSTHTCHGNYRDSCARKVMMLSKVWPKMLKF